uniref:Odorant binding protein n=1 Tax=Stomoxys calcitrans TaxID=35570 RepID=A0A1I8NZP5_STOCA
MQFLSLLLMAIIASSESQLGNISLLKDEYCLGDRAQEVYSSCAKSHNLGEAEIKRYLNREFAKSQNEKCFRACILSKCNFFNDDGTFKKDLAERGAALLSLKDPSRFDVVFKVMSQCVNSTSTSSNRCDSTEDLYECAMKNIPYKFTLSEYS